MRGYRCEPRWGLIIEGPLGPHIVKDVNVFTYGKNYKMFMSSVDPCIYIYIYTDLRRPGDLVVFSCCACICLYHGIVRSAFADILDTLDLTPPPHPRTPKNMKKKTFFLSPGAPKARDGRYCNAPRPSVCPSVCLSVIFSFRTVTQKRIDVFSLNFAGMCTMSWGCAV